MIEPCDLFKQIPKSLLNYLFDHSEASTELDMTFLGFENPYRFVKDVADKEMIIIDFGCAYATQSWYFRNHKKYIGVDAWSTKDGVIHTENSEYHFITIQDFIKNVWPVMQLAGWTNEDIFAICSAVPDEEARELVLNTFENCLDWYPGEKVTVKQHGELCQYKEEDLFDFSSEKDFSFKMTSSAAFL